MSATQVATSTEAPVVKIEDVAETDDMAPTETATGLEEKKAVKQAALSAATDTANRNALTRLARQSGILMLQDASKSLL